MSNKYTDEELIETFLTNWVSEVFREIPSTPSHPKKDPEKSTCCVQVCGGDDICLSTVDSPVEVSDKTTPTKECCKQGSCDCECKINELVVIREAYNILQHFGTPQHTGSAVTSRSIEPVLSKEYRDAILKTFVDPILFPKD